MVLVCVWLVCVFGSPKNPYKVSAFVELCLGILFIWNTSLFKKNTCLRFVFHDLKKTREVLKYYLYIDECGDHNLERYDPVSPIFTLCGMLMTRENRKVLGKSFENLKKIFFRNKGYHHSFC